MAVMKRSELTIHCRHQAGELSRVLDAVAKAGVNVLAFCGYGHDKDATILLVPNDETKASAALKKAGFTFETKPAVVVTTSSGPGEGAKLAQRLASASINIEYAYASTSGQGDSTAVFSVTDVEKALRVIG